MMYFFFGFSEQQKSEVARFGSNSILMSENPLTMPPSCNLPLSFMNYHFAPGIMLNHHFLMIFRSKKNAAFDRLASRLQKRAGFLSSDRRPRPKRRGGELVEFGSSVWLRAQWCSHLLP